MFGRFFGSKKTERPERPSPASPDFGEAGELTDAGLDELGEQASTAASGGNPGAWVDRKFLKRKAENLRDTLKKEKGDR